VNTAESTSYHPIHLDSLALDSLLDFDLYIKISEDRFVFFRNHSLQFSAQHRESLLSNDIQELYVSVGDRESYGNYVEQNIGRIVSDPQVPDNRKAELIYSVSQGVLKDAFQNPRSGDLVSRTERVITPTVDYILKGKHSVQNLISIMSYDYYTFTHSINVCVFTVALASQMGMNDSSELKEMAIGALLHDIGKSEVPKAILNKPGRLTNEEMKVMQEHVMLGERILSANPRITRFGMLPVSLHHEKLDGKGYPRALQGEQIHRYGRIAAIADCFDAMTTSRTYRAAMSGFEALGIMKGQMGSQLDQTLLDEFIPLLEKSKKELQAEGRELRDECVERRP
jgi:HD-GYP domain-containing protein (c-di-GMP phosphodiesterase class II)